MSSNLEINGSCLCGSVQVKCQLEDNVFDACHCGMCRKWGGGPALMVNGKHVRFSGEEFITRYESSAWAERAFCSRCGTHLFYRLKEGDFQNFPLGLFDEADKLNFHMQIFVDRKPENYSFSNKTEQMTEAEVIAKFSP